LTDYIDIIKVTQ